MQGQADQRGGTDDRQAGEHTAEPQAGGRQRQHQPATLDPGEAAADQHHRMRDAAVQPGGLAGQRIDRQRQEQGKEPIVRIEEYHVLYL